MKVVYVNDCLFNFLFFNRYRIMAIDHGMLSFIDVQHGQWPIALLTNPKHALFLNSHRENVESIKRSSHIRF